MEHNKKDKGIRAVVVDDSDFSRQQVVTILEENDIPIAGQANNAEEGLNISASSEANLFIIDLVMPLRSGLELAKVLAEKPGEVYIIIMSSVNMESLVIESISSGAIDFLPKPFTDKQLMQSVNKITQDMLRE